MTTAASGRNGATETFFGEPVAWRAEAAHALGIAIEDLPAAISPGASFPTVLRGIVHALPKQVRTIVDIGSGGGGASEYLRRATGATVYAVEPSRPARETASECFPLLHQVDGVATDTGLPDRFADAVVMCGVLSLIDDAQPVMIETVRLLSSPGVLAIADLFATGGRDRHSRPNVFRTPDTVSDLCAAHGLLRSAVTVGGPTPDPEWAAVAARVDDWIERECRDRDGYDAWHRDREHLDGHIANGDVLGGCVMATRLSA